MLYGFDMKENFRTVIKTEELFPGLNNCGYAHSRVQGKYRKVGLSTIKKVLIIKTKVHRVPQSERPSQPHPRYKLQIFTLYIT